MDDSIDCESTESTMSIGAQIWGPLIECPTDLFADILHMPTEDTTESNMGV